MEMKVKSQGLGKIWPVALLALGIILAISGSYSAARDISNDQSDALHGEENMLKGMSLEEKIGQMFMLDFRKEDGLDVTVVDRNIAAAIKKLQPGGVVLFRENTVTTAQTLNLVRGFQKASPRVPLFIGIDQEGGAVTRLQSGTVMPGNMALGAAGDRHLAYTVAKATGEELKALGINIDFAPVVDVNNNPANPVIGIRSFGDNPEGVADFAVSFMKGLHDSGIIAAAKHFPGHGDTAMDSHIDLPTVPYGLERLEKIELLPFTAMIRNGVDIIMTAHVTFPAIDDRQGVPATLSYQCLTGLLREQMGFRGVIITDAFSMKAITDHFGDKEAAAMAIKAGADIVLMPQNMDETFSYILEQVKSGEISEARIDDSVRRILALKIKSGIIGGHTGFSLGVERRAMKIVGGKKHALIRRVVAERAVTLIKNQDGVLPFRLEDRRRIVFFAPSQAGTDQVKKVLDELTEQAGLREVMICGFNYDGQDALNAEQADAVTQGDFVLLFTRTVNPGDLAPGSSIMSKFVGALISSAAASGKKLAAVAVRNPYDIQSLIGVPAYLAVYSDWNGGGVAAAVNVIFGKLNPHGKLPVSILDDSGTVIYANGYGLSYPTELESNKTGKR